MASYLSLFKNSNQLADQDLPGCSEIFDQVCKIAGLPSLLIEMAGFVSRGDWRIEDPQVMGY